MEISLQGQLLSIVYSVLLGLFLGLIYDLISVVGYIFNFKNNEFLVKKHLLVKAEKQQIIKKISLFLLDLSFFVIVTPLIAIFVYGVNNGIVRWYLAFGCIIGVVIYKLTVGRLVDMLLGYLSLALRWLLKKAFIPVKLLIKKLRTKFHLHRKENIKSSKKVVMYIGANKKEQG